jgi:hypothetical protein
MSYVYEEHREALFTERGQFAVCEALLDAQHLAAGNGLIPHDRLSDRLPGGDSYSRLAIIDRLLELRYLVRADNGDKATPRQAWIYRWIARSRT